MLHDPIIALIRTFVPTAIGAFLAWAAAKGVGVDENASAVLTAFFVALATALYYAAVTWLERKVDPLFGWLLGLPKAPSYTQSSDSNDSDSG